MRARRSVIISGVDDDLRGGAHGAVTAPRLSADLHCGANAEREAIEAFERLDGGLEPLVREHALAIVSALLREEARGGAADGCLVRLQASVDERELRVELGDECFDLRPEAVSRRFEGLPGPVVALVERLADSWGISYDGELRLWFAIAR